MCSGLFPGFGVPEFRASFLGLGHTATNSVNDIDPA